MITSPLPSLLSEFNSSPLSQTKHESPHSLYRSVRLLHEDLSEHCRIYFEESLYSQALNILISVLTAGNTPKDPPPAFLPPPQHLALAATLIVHPTLTIRAKSQTQLDEANLALKYLRSVLDTVGPVNSNLRDAFTFSGIGTSSRRGGSGRRRTTADDASPGGKDVDDISNHLAQSGALWSQAEDIWQVIGWAFNCSVLHKKRWDRWLLWLDLMIDVFQEDWDVRGEHGEDGTLDPEHKDAREQSMIAKSLNSEGASTGRDRKVLRAVFADGGRKAAAEFPEIWKNETKERKKDTDLKKIETKIDIEADDYGDYLQEDDESDLEDSDPECQSASPPKIQTSITTLPNVATPLGGTEAVNLRLRLLFLISNVSATLPHTFTPLATLYDTFLEHIRPLPLPTFFLIISPSSFRFFSPSAASCLTQYILRSFIASSAPLPAQDDLAQDVLEHSYLPYPASTSNIADNAKVSLCLETLLRLLDNHVGLTWSPSLQQAMEVGLAAREAKATKAGKKRGRDASGSEREEKIWLHASAERIRSTVQMLRL